MFSLFKFVHKFEKTEHKISIVSKSQKKWTDWNRRYASIKILLLLSRTGTFNYSPHSI